MVAAGGGCRPVQPVPCRPTPPACIPHPSLALLVPAHGFHQLLPLFRNEAQMLQHPSTPPQLHMRTPTRPSLAATLRFKDMGANNFYTCAEADEVDGLESVVDDWVEGLWAPLKQAFNAAAKPDAAKPASGAAAGAAAAAVSVTATAAAAAGAGLAAESSAALLASVTAPAAAAPPPSGPRVAVEAGDASGLVGGLAPPSVDLKGVPALAPCRWVARRGRGCGEGEGSNLAGACVRGAWCCCWAAHLCVSLHCRRSTAHSRLTSGYARPSRAPHCRSAYQGRRPRGCRRGHCSAHSRRGGVGAVAAAARIP